MAGPDLLRELHSGGFMVVLDPPDAIVVSPASRLTPELRAAIRANKPDLIAVLSEIDATIPEPLALAIKALDASIVAIPRVAVGQRWRVVHERDSCDFGAVGSLIEIVRVIGDAVGYRYETPLRVGGGSIRDGVTTARELYRRCRIATDKES